jgi:hypothetical protein
MLCPSFPYQVPKTVSGHPALQQRAMPNYSSWELSIGFRGVLSAGIGWDNRGKCATAGRNRYKAASRMRDLQHSGQNRSRSSLLLLHCLLDLVSSFRQVVVVLYLIAIIWSSIHRLSGDRFQELPGLETQSVRHSGLSPSHFSKAKEGRVPPFQKDPLLVPAVYSRLLGEGSLRAFEQAKYQLVRCVRLCQGRESRLGQYLELGEICNLLSNIGISER